MPIDNIDTALKGALDMMIKTYGLDPQTSLYALQQAVGEAYGSTLPAEIWDDGSISVITDKGQRDFNISNDKLGKIKKSLSETISYFINRNNASIFKQAALANRNLFYFRIDTVEGRHVKGRIYCNLSKNADKILLNGVAGKLQASSKTLLKNDLERGIIQPGKKILVCLKSIFENPDGTLVVNFVRRDKRLVEYVVRDTFNGLKSIGAECVYEHWINFENNVLSIKMRVPLSSEHKHYVSIAIRKRLNCIVRLIEEEGEL